MAKKNTYDASSITVLEGLEAVRKRPGMYIGSVSRKGLNHLIYEIVDNAVDEHLAGYCSNIFVTLEKDGSATIKDNGRGIPVGMHEKGISAERLVFTTLHAGGKFDNSAYKTSGGLHGVGSSVVNALSTYLDIKVSREGYVHHDHYERGIPTIELEDGLLPTLGKTRETGTEVNFLPDPEIFEKTKFSATEVKSRLHETAYLNPNLTIHFSDKRGEEVEEITYHEPDGIVGFIKDMNKKCEVIHEPVYFKGESDGITVEVAFQYINEFRENVLGFCNNIYNAEGGTHLTGFKTTFTSVMNSYARELGILKEKDANFTGADIRNGNGTGGKIIFGIADKSREVVGFDKEEVFKIMDAIANAVADNCEPAIIPDITLQTVDGKTVIVVEVSEGRQRPYYIKALGRESGVYVRVAGTTRLADAYMVKELLF